MKYTLQDITNRFHKFNDMDFDSEISIQMGKILVEKFGFTDKKYYTHVNKELQMFDWKEGQGTLWLIKDGLRFKYEIFEAYDNEGNNNGKGWFCADIEEYSIKSYHGESFSGDKMTFLLTR